MVILRSLKGHFLRGSKTMKDDHGLCQLLSIFFKFFFFFEKYIEITVQQHVWLCCFNMKKHVFIIFLKESNQTLEIGIEALSIF